MGCLVDCCQRLMVGAFREEDKGSMYVYFFCTLQKKPPMELHFSNRGFAGDSRLSYSVLAFSCFALPLIRSPAALVFPFARSIAPFTLFPCASSDKAFASPLAFSTFAFASPFISSILAFISSA
jgi:hypothetical protein